MFLYSVISQGQKAFFTTFIKVNIFFDSEIIDPQIREMMKISDMQLIRL